MKVPDVTITINMHWNHVSHPDDDDRGGRWVDGGSGACLGRALILMFSDNWNYSTEKLNYHYFKQCTYEKINKIIKSVSV